MLFMMREFLETYNQAINLDDKSYDKYFPQGRGRSDFLLFDSQVVCEFKEVQNIQISNKIEKLSKKENLSKQGLKRDLYNSIENALSKANKQIQDTKISLSLPDALGLIILENKIVNDLSVLSLIDAVNRKMMMPDGLTYTDCVLCLDFVNTFSESDRKPVRPAQAVSRDTAPAAKLNNLLSQLMREFCESTETSLFEDWVIVKGDQDWFTDASGKYKSYAAKVDFKQPSVKEEYNWIQRLAQFLNRWWWVIPLPFICYDWFMR